MEETRQAKPIVRGPGIYNPIIFGDLKERQKAARKRMRTESDIRKGFVINI